MFLGVFIVEEVDGAGDEWSEDTTMVDVQTILGDFLKHVPEICLLHWWKHFSGKNQNFQSQDHSPQVPDYQNFCITGIVD